MAVGSSASVISLGQLTRNRPWLPMGALAAATLAVIASSAAAPLQLLLIVLASLGAAAVLVFPEVGLYAMFAFFLIQRSQLYEQYGILTRGVTAADLVGLIALAGYAIRCYLDQQDPLRPLRDKRLLGIVAAVTLYFGWQSVAVAWSPAGYDDLVQWIRDNAEALALLLLSVLLLKDAAKARRAAAVYVSVGIMLALFTLEQFVLHGGLSQATQSYRAGISSTFNPNELSVILALVPAFAVIAAGSRSAVRGALVGGATMLPILPALVVLASRTVLLAIPLALLFVLVGARGARRLGALVVGLLTVALGAALTLTNNVPAYVQTRFLLARTDNLSERLPLWQNALHIFDHHPIIGVGAAGLETLVVDFRPGTLINALSTGPSAHNVFIGAMADTGIVGFAFLVLMLGALATFILGRTAREASVVAILSLLFVSLLTGSFLQAHWFWVAVGILMALAASWPQTHHTTGESDYSLNLPFGRT